MRGLLRLVGWLAVACLMATAPGGAADRPAPAVGTDSVALHPATAPLVAELDRYLASAETSDELRNLLSQPERATLVANDALSLRFLKERFIGAPDAAAAGLTPAYLDWCCSTMLLHGNRLTGAAPFPSFRLLPAVQAPSWTAIWQRSFAPFFPAAAMGTMSGRQGVTAVQPVAALRAGREPGSRELGLLPAGTPVTILDNTGPAWLVSTGRQAGWIDAGSIAPTAAPYSGAISTGGGGIYFNDIQAGVEFGGWQSPWGWFYTPTLR